MVIVPGWKFLHHVVYALAKEAACMSAAAMFRSSNQGQGFTPQRERGPISFWSTGLLEITTPFASVATAPCVTVHVVLELLESRIVS
jgi:hypothetical protein